MNRTNIFSEWESGEHLILKENLQYFSVLGVCRCVSNPQGAKAGAVAFYRCLSRSTQPGVAATKFEARNPCLRRSGFAQAGEIRNNLE